MFRTFAGCLLYAELSSHCWVWPSPPLLGERRRAQALDVQEDTRNGKPKKPLDAVGIGTVRAAIWQNEVAGKRWYSINVTRIYRDADGAWKTAQSFGHDDLLVLARVADRDHSHIFNPHFSPGRWWRNEKELIFSILIGSMERACG